MPALTRKSKRRLEDSEEEDESDGEPVMGILEQRAARRQTAEEAAREAQQVRLTIALLFVFPIYTVLAFYRRSWCQ